MPQVRKLAPEEVQTIYSKDKGTRKLTEELYDAILADYAVGEYGEAVLDEDENRLTTRNRLRAAATRRHLGIEFRRTSGDMVRFLIVEHGKAAVAEPPAAVSSGPPAKKKGGRPKKSA
jgi:hypothetical protein